jgi:hypothetical protein
MGNTLQNQRMKLSSGGEIVSRTSSKFGKLKPTVRSSSNSGCYFKTGSGLLKGCAQGGLHTMTIAACVIKLLKQRVI